MKLRTKFQNEDFELGEVVDAIISTTSLVDTHIKLKAKAKRGGEHMFNFSRISELFELFEDYEEPKKHYWVIDDDGMLICRTVGDFANEEMCKQIGNYFKSEEEAKRAVEKLKALKRLKDKGFRFVEHQIHGMTEDGEGDGCAYFEFDEQLDKSDLDLLFGGEE